MESFSKRVKEEIKLNRERADRKKGYVIDRFLDSGSVTDPNKDYHLEFVCRTPDDACGIQDVLLEFGLDGKMMDRGGHIVVYIKDAAEIADTLKLMGAFNALMEYENVRIRKELSEKVNRRVNCEAANIRRAVSCGLRQKEDIELIERTVGLKSLDEGLMEVARLRLEFPDASLSELSEHLKVPIGKSGINHRMRRIQKIAEDIKKA